MTYQFYGFVSEKATRHGFGCVMVVLDTEANAGVFTGICVHLIVIV